MNKIDQMRGITDILMNKDYDYSISSKWGFWYLEDRRYIVHDFMRGAFYFINADSPAEAILKAKKRSEG